MRTMMRLFGIAAAVVIANCSWGGGDLVFDDELYADALEFYDENGEECVPDMETFVADSGDQGGDLAQGVPNPDVNPDEDRQGGDDNQFGGNQGDVGEQDGSGDAEHDGPGRGAGNDRLGGPGRGAGNDPVGGDESADHEPAQDGTGGPGGCDAYGCCAEGSAIQQRERYRCRCRVRVRGEDTYVLPECCELEPQAEQGEGGEDPPPPPPPPAEEEDPADEEPPADEEEPVEDPV